MTTTKIITNTIYLGAFVSAIILDIPNFPIYFGIVFVAIQVINIYATYVITNRAISNELQLVKATSPFTIKNLILAIPVILLYLVLNLINQWFSTNFLVTYVAIMLLSVSVQHLIIKGKITATLLIDNNKLVVNDFFIKTYNLETLTKIRFDGFNETYIAEFSNSKNLKIKKKDYIRDELDNFIAIMTTKSNYSVVLSDNIKTEIAALNNGI
ncbi:MAG: hypothetical protein WAT43_00125 [Chitinophagales bacterium]